jgi:hypothetical protein
MQDWVWWQRPLGVPLAYPRSEIIFAYILFNFYCGRAMNLLVIIADLRIGLGLINR